MVASAARLCQAGFSAVARFDGGLLHLVAMNNLSAEEREAFGSLFPRPPARNYVMGRAFVDACPIHFEDVLAETNYDPRTRDVLQRVLNYRTFMAVPIIREGRPIGVIGCGRREVRPFTSGQIELVKAFADQAVIAIENVRLFDEVQARTSELQQSLEFQTAIGDVLNVISRSPSDIQPVLDMIAETAERLCQSEAAYIMQRAGGLYRLAAAKTLRPSEYNTCEIIRSRSQTAARSQAVLHLRGVKYTCGSRLETRISTEHETSGRHRTTGRPVNARRHAMGVIVLRRTRPAVHRKQIELSPRLPTRRLSRSRTCGCSKPSSTHARAHRGAGAADGDLRGAPGHLAARPATCSPCSRPCWRTRRGSAGRNSENCCCSMGMRSDLWPISCARAIREERKRAQVVRPRPDLPLGRLTCSRRLVHVVDIRAEPGYADGYGPFVALADAEAPAPCSWCRC